MKSIPSLFACLLLILCAAPIAHCQTVFEKTKQKAEQGHAKAQLRLWAMYYYGLGTQKDPKKAFEWTKKAAEQGHGWKCWPSSVEAQFNLGEMYSKGEGTLKDLKQAARWIKKAYESKNPEVKEAAERLWNEQELWKYAEDGD